MYWLRSPIAAAAVLTGVLIAVLTGVLGLQVRQSYGVVMEMSRQRAESLAIAAAHLVDGDAHREVIEHGDQGSPGYQAAVAPLVAFHNALPDLFYVYTMVARNGEAFYVLDTAGHPELRVPHQLNASNLMEVYDGLTEGDWLSRIYSGQSYVTPEPETDSYGTFISGHAPIRASDGSIAGFTGVDLNVAALLQWKTRMKDAFVVSVAVGVLISAMVGVIVAILLRRIVSDAKRLERESLTDPLTGVWNRRAFEFRLDNDFRRYKRSRVNSSIVMIDIDHFKSINDTYGHDAGDKIIKTVVEWATAMLREADFVARWGGEEFVSILAETSSNEGVLIADRLRDVLASLEVTGPGGDVIEFTVSAGVSEFHDQDKTPDEVLARADEALYAAKKAGRNQVVSRLR